MHALIRTPRHTRTRRRLQTGAAIIEFALVAMIFLTALIGVMEFGRWLFTLNAAGEATRWGARLAVVCSQDDPVIKQKMRAILGSVTDSQISVQYVPTGCDASSCKTVTVQLSGATFTPLIPFMGATVALPPFTTSLPRELMNSAGNPVCS